MDTSDVDGEWAGLLVLLANLLAYLMILGFIIIVIFLMLKVSSHFVDIMEEDDLDHDGEESETDPVLLQQKTASLYAYYGSFGDGHQHSAATCSGSSNSAAVLGSDDEEEEEEGADAVKWCVICYEEEQNSFFVPCGHSATCLVCARRIYKEGNKVCPVCRRVIGRVRKL